MPKRTVCFSRILALLLVLLLVIPASLVVSAQEEKRETLGDSIQELFAVASATDSHQAAQETSAGYSAPELSSIELTTDARNVKAGDSFTINSSFRKEEKCNVVTFHFSYDGELFEYEDYEAAAGTTAVDTYTDDGYARVTLIVPGYDAKELGGLVLRAKDDAELRRGRQTVGLTAEYVLRDENEEKQILAAEASVSFTTFGDDGGGPTVSGDTNDDGVIDLIDLSNATDWFGFIEEETLDWYDLYVYFDFNDNGEIDIFDIAYIARLISTDTADPEEPDPTPDPPTVVQATPFAYVTKLSENQNELIITVEEQLSGDSGIRLITVRVTIDNNAAGTYKVGDYNVYVDTKDDTQIRACYILE